MKHQGQNEMILEGEKHRDVTVSGPRKARNEGVWAGKQMLHPEVMKESVVVIMLK